MDASSREEAVAVPCPAKGELTDLLRLAGPLVLTHVGTQLMSLVDSAMVGRLGAVPLAAISIGNGIFFATSVVGMGCVLGMDPLVAQAVGAGEHARARRIFGQGLRVAFGAALPLTILCALAPLLLGPAGVDPETARETLRFGLARAPNVLPLLLVVATRSYLQALGVTRPIVHAMIVANVVNLVANALLVFGDRALVRFGLPPIGLPAFGIVGSGAASTLAATASFAVVWLAVQRLHANDPASPKPVAAVEDEGPALRQKILRVGLPIGLQLLAEVGAFTVASVLAGRMSPVAVAAHQVALTLASLSFMVSLGIGNAATVRVGHAVGRRDTRGARRAGAVAVAVSAAFMSCAALLFVSIPAPLSRLVTDDPAVVAAAAELVVIAAVFQLSDGAQAVAAGALRGAGDTRFIQHANVVGHYFIGLPIAVALGFGLDMGAPGLWWGLSVGLTAVAVSLAWRFWRLSSRPIARL